MSWLKSLKPSKAGSGPLTGKTIKVQAYNVKAENVLGEGGFATIYRCSDNTTKATFALKHFRLSGHPEAVADVHTEVAVMRALRDCPHALSLRAVAFSGPAGAEEEAFLLLDFCKENLVSYLQARQFRLDDATILRIFLPVCRAVQAMHSLDPPLAHRDLKAENVLLHTNDHWVLCDFGSATHKQQVYDLQRDMAREEENIRKHTTPAYRAPEMWELVERHFIGIKVDIWALGCLLYLLCYGRLPFDAEAKLQIMSGRYSMPGSRPEQLRGLVRDMLVVDASKRLGIDEVVRRVEQLAPSDLAADLGRPAASPHYSVSPSQSAQSVSREASPPAAGRAGPSQAPPAPTLATGGRAAAAVTAAGVAASQKASGSFWQTQQPQQQQQQDEEEGGWASFGSQPNSPAAAAHPAGGSRLYPSIRPTAARGEARATAAVPVVPGSTLATPSGPSLYPTVGAFSPPSSSQHGSIAGETSWTQFGSPARQPGSTSNGAGAATPMVMAPEGAEDGVDEGPLSAGFKVFSSSRPSRLSTGPGSTPSSTPSADLAMGRQDAADRRPPAIQPMPYGASLPASATAAGQPTAASAAAAASSALAAAVAAAVPGRASSELGAGARQSTPHRLSNVAVSSLPGSPRHSRDSSRGLTDISTRSLGSGVGAEGLSDLEQLQLHAAQLEEHCRVLEQLLEERTSEVGILRQENARQAHELQQFRAQQQHPQHPARLAQSAGTSPGPLSRSSSLGSTGKASHFRAEGAGDMNATTPAGASSWVAFGSSAAADEQAPTPTLTKSSSKLPGFTPTPKLLPLTSMELTPSAASKGPGSMRGGGAAAKAGAAATTPAPAVGATLSPAPATPLADLLGSTLDLGSNQKQQQHAGAVTSPAASPFLSGGAASNSVLGAGGNGGLGLGLSGRAVSGSLTGVLSGGHHRGGSGGSASASGSFSAAVAGGDKGWDRQLPFVEFNPLDSSDSEAPKPLREVSGKARSGASSVQPSPTKPLTCFTVEPSGGSAGVLGSSSSTASAGGPTGLGGSPLKSRPSSKTVMGEVSPTKRSVAVAQLHRRQVSEPFFKDLDPLG